MRFFIALALILQAVTTFGVDFTKLSRDEPVSTTYPATFKCYVDVSLSVDVTQAYRDSVFLRITYIIGKDTLNDNLEVNGSVNKVVKQLFLDEGERLKVSLRLNNQETEEIEKLNGSIRVVRNPDFKPAGNLGKSAFLSSVWKSDQTPLFRIVVEDSVPKFFRLNMEFNQNYEFDKFYFKMKVISPKDGIIMLDKAVTINERPIVDRKQHSVAMDISEVDMSQPGTYYFQVMSNMSGLRVNGIENVSYEIVKE